MRIKIDNILDLNDSNLFLRAMWAEFRNQFGVIAWGAYQPAKYGSTKRIYLGNLKVGEYGSFLVSLSYGQKIIVTGLNFGDDYNQCLEELSELGIQLKNPVDRAIQHRHHPKIWALAVYVSSPKCTIAPYFGNLFEILPDKPNTFLL